MPTYTSFPRFDKKKQLPSWHPIHLYVRYKVYSQKLLLDIIGRRQKIKVNKYGMEYQAGWGPAGSFSRL